MLRIAYINGKSVTPIKRMSYRDKVEAGAAYLMQKWSAKDEAEAEDKLQRLEKLGRINN